MNVMKGFSEWLSLNEGLNYPCIVVDVQPEYCKDNPRSFISAPESICERIINFVAKQTGPVLMFVNAEDTGLTYDTAYEIKQYWEDILGYYPDWNRFQIVDKGYGYLRSWMDNGIPDNIIIATIRELYRQKQDSTENLQFKDKNLTPIEIAIKQTIEDMRGDPITVYWTSIAQLKKFNGAYIMGGGRNECLREVELLMNAFNIKYKRIDSLVYGK
jgi:hypothetical protein